MKKSFIALIGGLLLSGSVVFAASYTVTMNNDFFSPATLTIGKGDSVTWTNVGTFTHNTMSGSGCVANGLWASPNELSHGAATFTFTNLTAPSTNPYFCSIHCAFGMVGTLIVTNSSVANVPPSVSITNVSSGAKFSAPADLVLMASASDSDGSVTNVQFFSGGGLLGNVTSPPFNFSVNNLAAGNYSFSATAYDNLGAATTSSVVNVFVLTNAVLTSPIRLANGQFQFTIQGIANQTYTTEASSNLATWFSLSTNVASGNNFDVLDPTAVNGEIRFYRVRQDF